MEKKEEVLKELENQAIFLHEAWQESDETKFSRGEDVERYFADLKNLTRLQRLIANREHKVRMHPNY